jgi:hypothetical protein
LILSDCGLSDCEPIALPLLTKLDVSKNNFKSLNTFIEFPSLVSLNINENPIGDDAFEKCGIFKSLKELKMNFSSVKNLENLASKFPQLFVFTAIGAQLNSIDDVVNFISNEPELAYFNIKGCPVNQDIYPDNDLLAEYGTEKEYDQKYPETSYRRGKYRKELITASKGRFYWLDGIRVLGKHAEKAPYLSKYDVINEEGNLVNFEKLLETAETEAEDIPEFFFEEKGDPNKNNTDDDEEIFYSQIHNHKLNPFRTGHQKKSQRLDESRSFCNCHPVKFGAISNAIKPKMNLNQEKKHQKKRRKTQAEFVDYI